jgi:hypothetical protein
MADDAAEALAFVVIGVYMFGVEALPAAKGVRMVPGPYTLDTLQKVCGENISGVDLAHAKFFVVSKTDD